MQFVNLGQAQIISAPSPRTTAISSASGRRTPIRCEDKADAKYLCSGADAGAIVPGALIVRADYAKEQPENVAKFLAVFLRGWSWAKANPAEARALALDFYRPGRPRGHARGHGPGVRAAARLRSRRAAEAFRPRAEAPRRSTAGSRVIGAFMTDVGTLPQSPDAEELHHRRLS